MIIDKEDRFVLHEFQFDGRLITPGAWLKIRGEKHPYMFACIVTSLINQTAWFECVGDKGEIKYFHPDKIERIVTGKRSFWKNV